MLQGCRTSGALRFDMDNTFVIAGWMAVKSEQLFLQLTVHMTVANCARDMRRYPF